jgi:glutamine amidotransferase
MGNLSSVKKACAYAGMHAEITDDPSMVLRAAGVILPGVGAFGDAMETLRAKQLVAPMLDGIATGKPFLGICLGMQLLMTESEEFGTHRGLNIFRGRVILLPMVGPDRERIKVPQVGWNTIVGSGTGGRTSLLDGIADGAWMYFVHSYRVVPEVDATIVTMTTYGGVPYVSGIARENVTAFQFHPEKSCADGLMIYKNFARLVHASPSYVTAQ